MKEKSYTDLMKASAHKQKNNKESYVVNLYIEMLLTEVLLKAEKEKVMEQIDRAIDERDQLTFLKLSEQYKELTKRFGT
ncbi:IDEAL domain-containing protein [Cytobacillus spongiae]|jgi:uncharacterized protein YpiB (UPF0302 family)|uniref:IDEAL domain-containing protein n=1 Tax=Cytobacillus spongiae TaxID=2901381 RepID=UPI001F33E7A4|nr:IDEAL domain-containing protein [Cytobacillus spongiae]UII56915.1 IDEAL domain-containing protein [Cytobacillus spongiae]